jgi:hypothetical protein
MADTITVRALGRRARDGGAKVVLVEDDPRHPHAADEDMGHVHLAEGDGPVEVGRTPAVLGAIKDGRLELVSGKLDAPPSDADLTVKTDADGQRRTGR